MFPKLNKCLDSFGDAEILAIPDGMSGYWHSEEDKSKCKRSARTLHPDMYKFSECFSDFVIPALGFE